MQLEHCARLVLAPSCRLDPCAAANASGLRRILQGPDSRVPTHTPPQPHLSQSAPCVGQHVIPGYQEILAHPLPAIAMTPNATPDICSATSSAATRSHGSLSFDRRRLTLGASLHGRVRVFIWEVQALSCGRRSRAFHLARGFEMPIPPRILTNDKLRVPVMTSQRIDSSIYKACGRDSDMAGLRGGRCWHRCFFNLINFISDSSRLRSAQQRATQTAAGQNRACCNRRAVSTARRVSDWPRISLSMS